MMLKVQVRVFSSWLARLAVLGALAFGACQPQKVILAPRDNDLVVLNGCVISACNYLAVV